MKNRMYDFLKTIQILANKKEKGCWCCNKEISVNVEVEMPNIEKMSMEVTNNEENRRERQNDKENSREEMSTEESSKNEFKTKESSANGTSSKKSSCKEPNDDICRKDEPNIYKCGRDTQNSDNCSRNTQSTKICETCMPSTGKCKAPIQNSNNCSRDSVNPEKCEKLNSNNCSRDTVNTRKCKIPIQNTEKHRPNVPNIKSVIRPALDTNNCRTSNNHRIPNNYRLPYPSIDRLCKSCSKHLTKEFLSLNSMTDGASFYRNTDFSLEHSEHINTIKIVISNIKVLDKDIYDSYLNNFNTVLDLQEYCNLFYTYFHFENLFSDEEIMSLNPDSEPNITKVELKNLLATIIYYYNSNIYHNILHAFDVFFTGIYLLQKYDRKCTKEELIVFSLSLVMHDIGHLGFISKIIEERTDVANYVKDTIIQKYDFSDGTSCDIKIISHGLNERLHIKIIENILIEYFEPSIISKIQRLVLSTDILKNEEYEKYIRSDNDLFLMLIKVSDLANGAKCYEISDKIGRQVYCENNVASNYLRRGRYGRFSLTDITSSCEYLKTPSVKRLIDTNLEGKSASDKSAKDIVIGDSALSDSAVKDNALSDISASYADKLANGTIKSNNHTDNHGSVRDRPISSIDFLNPKAMCDSHSNDIELITRSMFESKQCYIKNQIWYLNFCISFFKNMHDIFGVIDLVPGTKENLKKFRRMCRFKDNDATSNE